LLHGTSSAASCYCEQLRVACEGGEGGACEGG
jgi:hypothetical protein